MRFTMTIAAAVRSRIAGVAAGCCICACASVPSNHVARGDVRLGQGGEAVAKFTSQGVDRLFVALTNGGAGDVQFTVSDEQGRALESGALGAVGRNFTWRPLDSYVVLTLRAPSRATTVQYRASSESAFGVEWNLSNSVPTRLP